MLPMTLYISFGVSLSSLLPVFGSLPSPLRLKSNIILSMRLCLVSLRKLPVGLSMNYLGDKPLCVWVWVCVWVWEREIFMYIYICCFIIYIVSFWRLTVLSWWPISSPGLVCSKWSVNVQWMTVGTSLQSSCGTGDLLHWVFPDTKYNIMCIEFLYSSSWIISPF